MLTVASWQLSFLLGKTEDEPVPALLRNPKAQVRTLAYPQQPSFNYSPEQPTLLCKSVSTLIIVHFPVSPVSALYKPSIFLERSTDFSSEDPGRLNEGGLEKGRNASQPPSDSTMEVGHFINESSAECCFSCSALPGSFHMVIGFVLFGSIGD